MFSWQAKFEKCKVITEIKELHCLTFTADKSGCLKCKTWFDQTSAITHRIFSNDISVDLPEILHPNGLSSERQKYLFKNIRIHCPAMFPLILFRRARVGLPREQ